MKTQGSVFPGRAPSEGKASFSTALKQTAALPKTPPPLPRKPGVPLRVVSSLAPSKALAQPVTRAEAQSRTSHEQTSARLSHARSLSNHTAAQLQHVRAAHHQSVSDRLDGRLVDLICKELVIEFSADARPSSLGPAANPLAPPTPTLALAPQPAGAHEAAASQAAPARAAQAMELIERIETFIKDSRRPSIAITLNNSLGAKVEIERTGTREVALKVIGHKGPPRAEDISRIREEMQARGLKVCALSVA